MYTYTKRLYTHIYTYTERDRNTHGSKSRQKVQQQQQQQRGMRISRELISIIRESKPVSEWEEHIFRTGFEWACWGVIRSSSAAAAAAARDSSSSLGNSVISGIVASSLLFPHPPSPARVCSYIHTHSNVPLYVLFNLWPFFTNRREG